MRNSINMNTELMKDIDLNVRYVKKMKNCDNITHKPIPWRRLFDYEILFVTKGEIVIKNKMEEFSVQAGQLHIQPPNQYHSRYFIEGNACDYYSMHLDFFSVEKDKDFNIQETYIKEITEGYYKKTSKLKSRAKFENLESPSIINIFDKETFTAALDDLCEVYENQNDPFHFLSIKQKAYALLICVLQECVNNNVELFEEKRMLHSDIIKAFINYTHQNYAQKIDLFQFAQKHGISKNHFCKVFKKQTNISPHAFVVSVRINESKKLLRSGKYMVSEIAYMVGYDDIAYFSRLFKQKENVSPLEYLKKHS